MIGCRLRCFVVRVPATCHLMGRISKVAVCSRVQVAEASAGVVRGWQDCHIAECCERPPNHAAVIFVCSVENSSSCKGQLPCACPRSHSQTLSITSLALSP